VKPAGAKTVAEIYADKAKLAGQPIVLRAKVVRVVQNIMGKNWLHLRDGTGGPDANDLTVTTPASATVGQIVTVKGVLSVDRDFGSGYRYAVIIEDAVLDPK
jgi:hypothetical protein